MRYTFVVPLYIVYALDALCASPLPSVLPAWAHLQYSPRRLYAKYGRPVSAVMFTVNVATRRLLAQIEALVLSVDNRHTL